MKVSDKMNLGGAEGCESVAKKVEIRGIEGLFMKPFIAVQSVSMSMRKPRAPREKVSLRCDHKKLDEFLIASFCVNIRQSLFDG